MEPHDNIAAFLETQLDFIFFFYGLAFLLLGIVCLSIAKVRGPGSPWTALGLFALIHGIGEWLDLGALILGDTPSFASFRILAMTGSFMLLMEFARLKAIEFHFTPPGRWIYLPLLTMVALSGAGGDMSIVSAASRYIFGFGGAIATSLVFFRHAGNLKGTRRYLAILSALGFVFYAIAAGAIVHTAPIWPATAFNQGWFMSVTGVPIQLVRGILACVLAFSVWAIWGHLLVAEVSSERYTAYMRRQFLGTAAAMAAILILGWTLTEFLGGVYRQNIQEEAAGDIDLLASRLSGETATIDGMVKALAGSPSILPLLTGGSPQDNRRARAVLDLHVEASGSATGILLDAAGTVIASSSRDLRTKSYHERTTSWIQKALAGDTVYRFDFDTATRQSSYLASYPVRSDAGAIVGVAILEKPLDKFETSMRHFGRPYFLISPDGIVVLTNRQDMFLRPLWPLSETRKTALAAAFGVPDRTSMLDEEIVGAGWMKADGRREYISRQFVAHSQWSLVIAMPTGRVFASRVLGIVITLLVTVMTLTYFAGREYGMRESIQQARRQELQELARDLRYKATTDPLTGLYNRLKFDEALASEMSRAERYGTPLSLMIYDVDHFKEVNDVFGHQAGDMVLVQLSDIVSKQIRATDVLARWGGEEFAILVPGSDGDMAQHAAAKLVTIIKASGFDGVGTITCSFGVAQYADGDTADTLVARVDNALYRAKMNGRNRAELAMTPGSSAVSASVA